MILLWTNLMWVTNLLGNEWNRRCSEITFNHSGNANNSQNHSTDLTPADEYFHYQVLKLTPDVTMGDIDQLNYKVVLCLFIAWFLIFLSLSRGIKSMGKVRTRHWNLKKSNNMFEGVISNRDISLHLSDNTINIRPDSERINRRDFILVFTRFL